MSSPVRHRVVVKVQKRAHSTLLEGTLQNDFFSHDVLIKRFKLSSSNNYDYVRDRLRSCEEHSRRVKSFPMILQLRWVDIVEEYGYAVYESFGDNTSVKNLLSSEYKDQLFSNGYPTQKMNKILLQVVEALQVLHKQGLVHGYLATSNTFVDKDSCTVKLSGLDVNGIQHRRHDMISLARLIYFCYSRGTHYHETRDGHVDSSLIDYIPEAADLFEKLMYDPERLNTSYVLSHPLFWDTHKRFAFYLDVGGWLEDPSGRPHRANDFYQECSTLGSCDQNWKKRANNILLNLSKSKYKTNGGGPEVMRFVRNLFAHKLEYYTGSMILWAKPRLGLENYISTRFPGLLMRLYNFFCKRNYCVATGCDYAV